MSDWSIHTGKTMISIGPTESVSLDPVRIAAHSDRFSYQDYLTPERARELGQRLIAVAAAVEEGGPSLSFDEVVDRKMAELKFIDVAVPGEPSVSERMDRLGVPETVDREIELAEFATERERREQRSVA